MDLDVFLFVCLVCPCVSFCCRRFVFVLTLQLTPVC
jgi:hypothetical protein